MSMDRPDYDRALFEVLRVIRHMSDKEVAAKCFVTPTTIRKWRMGPRYGGTRYPHHVTLAAVARGVGLDFKLAPAAVVEKDAIKHRMEIAAIEQDMTMRSLARINKMKAKREAAVRELARKRREARNGSAETTSA